MLQEAGIRLYVRAQDLRRRVLSDEGNILTEQGIWIVVFILALIGAIAALKTAVGGAFSSASSSVSATY